MLAVAAVCGAVVALSMIWFADLWSVLAGPTPMHWQRGASCVAFTGLGWLVLLAPAGVCLAFAARESVRGWG